MGIHKHFLERDISNTIGTVGLSETRTALFLNFAVGHFLGGSSLSRLCMPFCFFIFYAILPLVQLIAFGSCCFQIYGSLMPCDGMPDNVLRVRAAPDKRHPR
jgi:hypothetical protein